MKRKGLVILLTVLLFLSAVALGVSNVFRVDGVAVEATTVSEQAKADAVELQGKLTELYKDESMFKVGEEKTAEALKSYPYLRLSGFEKAYPNKLVIAVTEDYEVYAVEANNGYYILGRDGSILAERETPANRLDGADNVLLKGLTATGEKGGELSGDVCLLPMLTLCKEMDRALEGIRANVLSVEVMLRTPQTFFVVTMKEGVKIYVGNPSALTERKAIEAVNKYLSLSDGERMTGRIAVYDGGGEVFASYSETDEFQG